MLRGAGPDRDLMCAMMFALREPEREHPVAEVGRDLFCLHRVRKLQGSLKRSVGALDEVEVLLLAPMLLLELLLSADRQHIAVERDVHVLFVDAW